MKAVKFPALDRFRLAAAILVIAIHTGPLFSLCPTANVFLTRVLARMAVPFFFMLTGYFLARDGWRSLGRLWRRTLLLYGASILLYLPLNLYQGGFPWRNLWFEGTFYHLWYLPAVLLGTLIARQLYRLGLRLALPSALLLYLIGLGGDSWYGLAVQAGLGPFYNALFTVFTYTRNGLFFAPLFLLLGAAGRQFSMALSLRGFLFSFCAMTAEAFLLRHFNLPRHDCFYFFLPLVMIFGFSLLLGCNEGRDRGCGKIAMLVYLLHPWCIVLVRGGSRLLGLWALLVENSLGHFLAVTALTLLLSAVLYALRPRRQRPKARAWRELDLEALCHNADVLQSALAPGCKLMAVVKADAYGHGAVPVARTLQRQGVHAFAVACLSEGIALRRAGIWGTILILGCTAPEDAALLRRWRLTQTVADLSHGQALSATGLPLRVHLALDTGMHRLGIPAEDHEALRAVYDLPHLRIQGVFSHLCNCEALTQEATAQTLAQLTLFQDALAWLQAQGCNPGRTHIQASYGIWNLPPQPCAYARPGIALYGVLSRDGPVQRSLDLRPVLSLRARVVSVRAIPARTHAGYGAAFTAQRDTVLATVSIGYGDGLPQNLPERGGQALLHGRPVPMVGRLCMDQMLLDVTDLDQVQAGDVVTIIGRDGGCEIRAEAVAAQCGMITNELLTSLQNRLRIISSNPALPFSFLSPEHFKISITNLFMK